MKKPKISMPIIIATLLVAIVSMAQLVFPVGALITVTEVSTSVNRIEILGREVDVTVHRYDIFKSYQHYVSFNATCKIDGITINVTTDEYPWYKLVSSGILSVPSSWKYWWDNVLFVKAPGPSEIYVKYDHPDNYDTYKPREINTEYSVQGNSKLHCHISQYRLEEDKQHGTLTSIVGALMGIVAAALAIPELVSKLVAGVVALIAAILSAAGLLITFFISDIVQTELGDGWSWIWGFGGYWIFKWWRQSFGKWRDWGWLFVIINLNSVRFGWPRGGGPGRWVLMK